MTIELMNQFLLISAPLPDIELPKLESCDKAFVFIHYDHVSNEVFFYRELSKPIKQCALLSFNKVSQLIKADAYFIPRYD